MSLLGAAAWAMWLGMYTALSPCALSANLAALAFIGRRVGRPRMAVLAGALFATGQVVAFAGLATLLVGALLTQARLSAFLQDSLSRLMGPLFIVVGVVMLQLLPLGTGGIGSERLRRRAERMGLFGAVLLGLLLALAFCPTTAALYFGQLLPLAIQHRSVLLLPAMFALGAALPVVGLACVLAFAAHRVGSVYARLTAFERWARVTAGVVFIAVGLYLSAVHIFGLPG